MKEGLPGGTLSVSSRSELEEAHAHVARWTGSESTPARRLFDFRSWRAGRADALRPDLDALRGLADRVGRYRQSVRAVIESMNGARFVHDSLEELGWEVLVADAQKVKGLAPLACKTDKVDAQLLAVLSIPWRCRRSCSAGGRSGTRR
jgi:transposase